jgi:hypothetical protein
VARDHPQGRPAVGSLLMRQAWGKIKSVSLELGGNAPFIVFDEPRDRAEIPGSGNRPTGSARLLLSPVPNFLAISYERGLLFRIKYNNLNLEPSRKLP